MIACEVEPFSLCVPAIDDNMAVGIVGVGVNGRKILETASPLRKNLLTSITHDTLNCSRVSSCRKTGDQVH